MILECVGSGGMAVVYAAYDANLDRKVALKLLPPAMTASADAKARLKREAQTMARVSHPNVVTVFEVGQVDDRMFVAMEYVAGMDLRTWLLAEKRTVPQILEMFVQAARGLAEAHAHGIIHRDFKPENCLVGPDGRLRVSDFGIARIMDDSPSVTPSDDEPKVMVLEQTGFFKTKVGVLVGSPAYMAPEQFELGPLDARTDIFSYGVAFFEALYGMRPFPGKTAEELSGAVLAGQMRERPRAAEVPRWLHALLVRACKRKPEQRFASMAELLSYVDRYSGSRKWWWIGGFGVAAIAAATAVAVSMRGASAPEVCTGASSYWVGVWDDTTRTAISKQFAKVESADMKSWPKVDAVIDGYVTTWSSMFTESCLSTSRHEQSTAMLDARSACLDRRRAEVGALITVLSNADRAVASHALRAARELTPIERCSEAAIAQGPATTFVDDKQRAAVATVEQQLATVKARFDVGSFGEATKLAEQAATKARETGHLPTLAEATYRLGLARWKAGAQDEASSTLIEATSLAMSANQQRVLASALIALTYIDGGDRLKLESATAWHALAEGLLHSPDADPELGGELENAFAMTLMADGRGEDAYKSAEKARELLTRSSPTPRPLVALNLNDEGVILMFLGRYDDSKKSLEAALQMRTDLQGPAHPDVSESRMNLGTLFLEMGDHDKGIATLRQALAGYEQALGPGHAYLAPAHSNLGLALLDDKHYDEALDHFKAALAIEQRTLGDDSPQAAQSMDLIGMAQEIKGDMPAAIEAFKQAIDMMKRAGQPLHANVGLFLTHLGLAQLDSGKPSDAVATLEQALGVRSQQRSSQRPCSNRQCDVSETKFALARALERRGGADDRAKQLARESLATFEDAGPAWKSEADDVREWLTPPQH